MPVLADRVAETSVSAGNGAAWNLQGAKLGYRSFGAGNGYGVVLYYSIVHRTSGQFEDGIGIVTAGAPDVLTRTTVLQGSAGPGVRVNFAAGTTDVFNGLPAEKTAYVDPTSGSYVIAAPTTSVLALAAASTISIANGSVGTPGLNVSGDTNTGLWWITGDTLGISTGGVEAVRLTLTAINVGSTRDLTVEPTKKFYLDGGADTYVYERSSNTVDLVAGGVVHMTWTSGASIIAPLARLYFDGGSDTYIAELASNRLSLVAGGVERGRFDDSVVAGDTALALWDVTGAAVVRVSRGAADTGGTGFRSLRIPN